MNTYLVTLSHESWADASSRRWLPRRIETTLEVKAANHAEAVASARARVDHSAHLVAIQMIQEGGNPCGGTASKPPNLQETS